MQLEEDTRTAALEVEAAATAVLPTVPTARVALQVVEETTVAALQMEATALAVLLLLEKMGRVALHV